tara:strand:- start:1572 stop:2810 length:1239 start_codon:yes stop_codon:yes gene_type:complete
MKFNPIRGTHDLFGEELQKFNLIQSEVHSLAKKFNFDEIQTPIFEKTELFQKPLGEQSDVVLKEMYTFSDRNDDLVTLRPEYTTPMIRAAISNNLLVKLPCKLFGIGPMFRRERPQKGRYRQFNQINFENLGCNDSFSDVELILIANNLLNNLIPEKDFKLHINSLGNHKTLQTYKKGLITYFNKHKNNLSKESIAKIKTNPLRILDSKNKIDKDIVAKAPLIYDFFSNEDLKIYEEVKKLLNNFNIKYVEDTSLVRGLDYYCNTVFEFKTQLLGSQDTLIGGGRYDGLVKVLGGNDIPGVGWAAGIERISMLMKLKKNTNNVIHFAIQNENFKVHALKAYKYLIDNNFSVYWNYKFNLKKSLSKSNENNASYIIIVGEEEYRLKKYTLKNLKDGNQLILNFSELLNKIKNG